MRAGAERYPWFECSCCPTNVVRLLRSLPGYVYADRGGDLNVGGTATVAAVTLTQERIAPMLCPRCSRQSI